MTTPYKVYILATELAAARELRAMLEALALAPATRVVSNLDELNGPFDDAALALVRWPLAELSQARKRLGELGCRAAIIAVVDQNDAEEQTKLLAAGYADTVALPTTAPRLGRLISYHLPDDDEDEELLTLYVENAQRHLAALEKAESEDDTESLVRLAHKIHGSAASFGFHRLGRAAATVETHGKAGTLSEAQRLELLAACRAAAQGSRD